MRIVPARGKVTTGADVKAFQDMIVTVRDRVQHRIDAGETEAQVLAGHPAAEFDARWGMAACLPTHSCTKYIARLKGHKADWFVSLRIRQEFET